MQHLQPQKTTTASATGPTQNGRGATPNVAAAPPNEEAFVEASLRQPAPRRVRTSRAVWKVRARVWNVNAALCLGAFYLLKDVRGSGGFWFAIAPGILYTLFEPELRRARQARLLRDGLAVTGTVTPDPVKTPFQINTGIHEGPTLRYRYQTFEGESRIGKVAMPALFAQRFAPGDVLTILYNPARPGESSPYAVLTDVAVE